MRKLTHEFENIEITLENGRVVKCVVDGVEGKWTGTSNRRVFQFGNKFVIKFDAKEPAVTEWGNKNVKVQNQREIDNYKLIDEQDRKYFAAILRTGIVDDMLYVVQEYVPNTRRAYKREKLEFDIIRKKYRIEDVALDRYTKYHSNIAVNKNGFKFYDLGWETRMPENEIQMPLF